MLLGNGHISFHRIHHHHNVFRAPQEVSNTGLHRWRRLDRSVNLGEVVDHEIEAGRVGQPAEPTHPHG